MAKRRMHQENGGLGAPDIIQDLIETSRPYSSKSIIQDFNQGTLDVMI
jgi:hypothetical protein